MIDLESGYGTKCLYITPRGLSGKCLSGSESKNILIFLTMPHELRLMKSFTTNYKNRTRVIRGNLRCDCGEAGEKTLAALPRPINKTIAQGLAWRQAIGDQLFDYLRVRLLASCKYPWLHVSLSIFQKLLRRKIFLDYVFLIAPMEHLYTTCYKYFARKDGKRVVIFDLYTTHNFRCIVVIHLNLLYSLDS